MSDQPYLGLCVAVLLTAVALPAQEVPLQVSGVLSTGFYRSSSHGLEEQNISFVPVGAKFDIHGYWMMSDFLDFTIQPEFTLGPQASEAGFQGGNGVRVNLSFLRRRSFPLRFRYSNVQVEDAYFGGLTQVSAYTMKNRLRDVGLTWELRRAGLPALIIDWGHSSTVSASDIALIPDYHSNVNHVNLDSTYERSGWSMDGFLHSQRQQSDVFAPLGDGSNLSSLTQNINQYQGSAHREVFGGADLHLVAGGQATSSLLFGAPIDLNTRFANANLMTKRTRRVRATLRGGYTSNLASQFLGQILTGIGNTGLGAIAPSPASLLPLQQHVSNVTLNTMVTADVSHGLAVYGAIDYSRANSAAQGPFNSSYVTTSAGVTYANSFRWGRLAGQYGRDLGQGSVTGQSGTIQGQTYQASLQNGTPERLQTEVSVRGTEQSVQNVSPLNSRSFTSEGSLARRVVGNYSARLGGGWQWGNYTSLGNTFHTNGFTAHADLIHPRLQLSASLNDTYGSSLPVNTQLIGGNPLGNLLVNSLHVLPSDYRGLSFSAHANPLRKVELAATWTRSRQHLDGLLNNDFELLNVHATYHFRRLQLEGGYIRANQIFLNYPETKRGRFYVRVSRPVKIL